MGRNYMKSSTTQTELGGWESQMISMKSLSVWSTHYELLNFIVYLLDISVYLFQLVSVRLLLPYP